VYYRTKSVNVADEHVHGNFFATMVEFVGVMHHGDIPLVPRTEAIADVTVHVSSSSM
jgi:hypothetical protein